MREPISARTLWAMHPDALATLMQQDLSERIVPEGLRAFMGGSAPQAAQKAPDPVREGGVLVLPLFGALSPNGIYWGGTATETFADVIREAAADQKVGAIVLRIRSPGGLVYGTQEAGDAVFEARQAKPVIAVADKYAFSAAHWIATQASAFYATPSGEVGSVGVRSGHVDMSGFEEKIGMKTTLIASDPQKIAGHPYAPLSDEDREEIQAQVDELNEDFVAAIARGRGIDKSKVPEMHGKGKTFLAKRAAALGVTDGVMSLREVVAKYGSSRARLDLMRRRAALQGQIASI